MLSEMQLAIINCITIRMYLGWFFRWSTWKVNFISYFWKVIRKSYSVDKLFTLQSYKYSEREFSLVIVRMYRTW